MDIRKATREYEAWLQEHTLIYRPHLALKHQLMREGPFAFLRATFYQWISIWPTVCADIACAPKVLAIGDLHIENFGTWRDSEGRLVWGINDFDEAYPLPYTNDLVRLAASAQLAATLDHLQIKTKETCEAILTGYMSSLKSEGQPFVLEEKHKRLRFMTMGSLRAPARFWERLEAQKPAREPIPRAVRKIVESLMPQPGLPHEFRARVSGLGSLGRYRVVAIADWGGGKVAREVKALAPSACLWAQKPNGPQTIHYQSLLDRSVRCRDPFAHVQGSWIARRLSPHCCRIELNELPANRDEYRLLHAMGWETANVHLGSRSAIKAVRQDLAKRPTRWLRDAARAMVKATVSDWEEWRGTSGL